MARVRTPARAAVSCTQAFCVFAQRARQRCAIPARGAVPVSRARVPSAVVAFKARPRVYKNCVCIETTALHSRAIRSRGSSHSLCIRRKRRRGSCDSVCAARQRARCWMALCCLRGCRTFGTARRERRARRAAPFARARCTRCTCRCGPVRARTWSRGCRRARGSSRRTRTCTCTVAARPARSLRWRRRHTLWPKNLRARECAAQ